MSELDPSFTPYSVYLEKLRSNVENLSPVQCQVVQGFFYGVCASILNDDVLHDVDNVLSWAGPDWITYYRSHCAPLHADIAHLAAVIPSQASEEAVETAAKIFETWFQTWIPQPYNTVFTMLANGVEGMTIVVPLQAQAQAQEHKPPRQRVHVSAIRKTLKRRARTGSPPPKPTL
jgi:hypothetical protein